MSEEGFAIKKSTLVTGFLVFVLVVSVVFSFQLGMLNNSLAEQQARLNQLASGNLTAGTAGFVTASSAGLTGSQAAADPMAGHHDDSGPAQQVGGC